MDDESLSSRRAWIEMPETVKAIGEWAVVALLTESVD